MAFPEVIAQAQRDSMLERIIEALDICEEVKRGLDGSQPHLVALDPDTFEVVKHKCNIAYTQLMKARQAIEERTA